MSPLAFGTVLVYNDTLVVHGCCRAGLVESIQEWVSGVIIDVSRSCRRCGMVAADSLFFPVIANDKGRLFSADDNERADGRVV